MCMNNYMSRMSINNPSIILNSFKTHTTNPNHLPTAASPPTGYIWISGTLINETCDSVCSRLSVMTLEVSVLDDMIVAAVC